MLKIESSQPREIGATKNLSILYGLYKRIQRQERLIPWTSIQMIGRTLPILSLGEMTHNANISGIRHPKSRVLLPRLNGKKGKMRSYLRS